MCILYRDKILAVINMPYGGFLSLAVHESLINLVWEDNPQKFSTNISTSTVFVQLVLEVSTIIIMPKHVILMQFQLCAKCMVPVTVNWLTEVT